MNLSNIAKALHDALQSVLHFLSGAPAVLPQLTEEALMAMHLVQTAQADAAAFASETPGQQQQMIDGLMAEFVADLKASGIPVPDALLTELQGGVAAVYGLLGTMTALKTGVAPGSAAASTPDAPGTPEGQI